MDETKKALNEEQGKQGLKLEVNLSGANLRGANLEGTGFTSEDLLKAGAKATPAIEAE